MGLPVISDHINIDDSIVIVQEDCIKRVSYETFNKNISLGGNTICQAVLNCWDSMGDFNSTSADTPPTFTDIFVGLNNRQQNYFFTADQFLTNYFDAQGDKLARVQILTGSNLIGVSFNGVATYVGQNIDISQIEHLEYDSQNLDAGYQQFVIIDVYDSNNVKAV